MRNRKQSIQTTEDRIKSQSYSIEQCISSIENTLKDTSLSFAERDERVSHFTAMIKENAINIDNIIKNNN